MTTFLPLVQQILLGLNSQSDCMSNISANATAVTSGTAAAASTTALDIPTDFMSLFTLLLPFSALRDWLRLVMVGGFIEMCRRFVFGGYTKLVNSFFITASFEEQDASYTWMMVWLSNQPSWGKARDVQVCTNSIINNAAIMLDGADEGTARFRSSRKLAYLPSLLTTYNLWYKRRWMTITRVQQQTGWYGSKEQTLYVTIMTRDHSILVSLLQEARKDYLAAQEHKMGVYVSDTSNNWRQVAYRDKRSMNSIILDSGVKEVLVEDAKDFLQSKQWYAERGIPHRRGYLLYGAPGSGKTSFIHSVAGELGLDVYIITLSRLGLDDSALGELVNALPERCVALMEDIDAAFTTGITRDTIAAVESQDMNAGKSVPGAPPAPTTSRLSLSGLLNALDGVGAQEGRILFATTNAYAALDSALIRPGRLDLHIEFKLASKFQAQQLFTRFYLPSQSLASTKEDEQDNDDDEAEDNSVDSGYDSAGRDGDEKMPPSPVESTVSSTESAFNTTPSEKPTYRGTSHQSRIPQLKRTQIAKLAVRFAEAIPEREISMASLQGYLMTYKTRPYAAVANVSAWLQKERDEKVARDAKEKKGAVDMAATAPPQEVVDSGASEVLSVKPLALGKIETS